MTSLEELREVERRAASAGAMPWQRCRAVPFGPNLVISDRDFCASDSGGFDSVLHVRRGDKPEHDCSYVACGGASVAAFNLVFDYPDGGPLDGHLDVVEGFVRGFRERLLDNEQARMLVHCAAGITRSPTLALFVRALLQDAHPAAFLGDLVRVMWSSRGLTPNICHRPLDDMNRFFARRGVLP